MRKIPIWQSRVGRAADWFSIAMGIKKQWKELYD